MRTAVAIAVTVLLLTACSNDDDNGDKSASGKTTTTSTSTTSTTTTTAPSTTTTTAFEGRTSPTTVPMSTDHVTLLTAVEVTNDGGIDRVTFQFRGSGTPLVDIGYVTDVRADGSGEPVAVEGEAVLSIRMEPASGVDLGGEDFERTYTGPDRVRGDTTTVTEVVRTGDFEANLTWAIGVRRQVPFRITTDAAAGRVVVELAG